MQCALIVLSFRHPKKMCLSPFFYLPPKKTTDFLLTALVLYKTIDSIVALGLPHHDPVTSAVGDVIMSLVTFTKIRN